MSIKNKKLKNILKSCRIKLGEPVVNLENIENNKENVKRVMRIFD